VKNEGLPPEEESRLREISRRLEQRYRTASLGNKPDPLDELVFIQLSIRTREAAYNTGFDRLKEACGGDWNRLRDLDEATVMGILGSGGMATIKRRRLNDQLDRIVDEFGHATLDPLSTMTTVDAERFLTSLPGVGPKTARCVLLYSLGREVFPVDSHCLRVLGRLGFAGPELDRKAAHNVLQDLVPAAIRHDLHVNLVHHGRTLCKPGLPVCSECPLLDLCPAGQLYQS
jgi:endonuclease III